MSEANKALIHRWFEEVWNKGREEAIDEMFAADGIAHGLTEEGDRALRGGGAGFKPFFEHSDRRSRILKSSWKILLPKATRLRRVAQFAGSINPIV